MRAPACPSPAERPTLAQSSCAGITMCPREPALRGATVLPSRSGPPSPPPSLLRPNPEHKSHSPGSMGGSSLARNQEAVGRRPGFPGHERCSPGQVTSDKATPASAGLRAASGAAGRAVAAGAHGKRGPLLPPLPWAQSQLSARGPPAALPPPGPGADVPDAERGGCSKFRKVSGRGNPWPHGGSGPSGLAPCLPAGAAECAPGVG